MKILFSIMVVILVMGCSDPISKEDLKNLNGYWEITSVTFPNGETKEYKVSTTVDYFRLEGLKGFRKKVQPKLDGTFNTSNDAESFTILKKNDYFEFFYKNELSAWSEILLDISPNRFSVKNEEGITYSYSRFEPFSVKRPQ
ncbi:hypothetical protein [Pareuzebyella sediminis]|nr:hypothetical protein [Pareuzebyella sediminis]